MEDPAVKKQTKQELLKMIQETELHMQNLQYGTNRAFGRTALFEQ